MESREFRGVNLSELRVQDIPTRAIGGGALVLLGVLFLFLVAREIGHGPGDRYDTPEAGPPDEDPRDRDPKDRDPNHGGFKGGGSGGLPHTDVPSALNEGR